MSDESHETIADIVSVNHQFREVAKMIPHEEVAVSKMETTTPTREKSSVVGNSAKMREALEKVRRVLHCAIVADILKGDDVNSAFNEVTAALSAPPRNCDKYTLAESLRKYGFPTKSKPWGEKEWLDFCEWYISESKGYANE